MPRRRNISLSYKQEESGIDESIFELKEAHNTIRYDWPQILHDSANPIEMAVALLDDTSVGMAHRYSEFENIKQSTENALRHVVNQHHELFNNSIGSYHLLLNTLQESQRDSLEIKEMLESATKDIHDRSDILNELSQTSTRYAEMIELLDVMAELNAIPDKIDQLVGEKKIHQVYDVISNGYKLAEQYNLWSLPAMNSVRSYLEMQSNNLFDMIVDELQNEIYLKSSAAERGTPASSKNQAGDASQYFRWQTLLDSTDPQLASFRTLIRESKTLEQYIYNSANLDIAEVTEVLTKASFNFIQNQLPKLHAHFANTTTQMATGMGSKSSGANGGVDYSILLESTSSFSAESFHYIYMLLHTASKLSRLGQVIEILNGNNQSELHGLINRATEEVKSKNIGVLGKLSKLQNFDHSSSADIIGNNNFSDSSIIILQDLFGTIFIRSLAVLQRHKIVSEIVDRIESAQNLNITPAVGGSASASPSLGSPETFGSKSYDLHGIWNTIKKELQSLMLNYIYDSNHINLNGPETGVLSTLGKNSKIHDVLRKRDLFRFEDVSYDKSTKTAEDLQVVLQDMFPGFVLSDSFKTKSGQATSPYIKNERFNAVVEILVPRNLYNMRIILEFFLIFVAGSHRLFSSHDTDELSLQRAYSVNQNRGQHLKPPANRFAIQFFEDFMKMSFLSHVKESIDNSFREYIGGNRSENTAGGFFGAQLKLDLISLDKHESITSPHRGITNTDSVPTMIYQNALDFKRLFLNICSILNTSLTYREAYSSIVLAFLNKFCDSYNQFYRELLSSGETEVADFNAPTGTTSKPISKISKWIKVPALIEVSGTILDLKSKQAHEDVGEEAKNLLASMLNKELEIFLFNGGGDDLFDINKDDLLDNESFNQVCYFLLTTSWILGWLPLVKKESNYNVQGGNGYQVSIVDKLRYDWSFLENGRSIINVTTGNNDIISQNIYLALSKEKIQKFDEIVQKFQYIRDRTLLALRYDLRCKAIYYIGKSFRQIDWMPSTEPGDADQFIGILNKEVFSIYNKLTNFLGDSERESIFVGLSEFLNQLAINGSILVRKINTNGVKRVLLNIFTLQQMLRNLLKNPEEVDFARSSVYFELFTANEFSFVKFVKANSDKFTLEEYKNMVRLKYSEKLADGNGTSFNKTKYNDLLKKVEVSLGVA